MRVLLAVEVLKYRPKAAARILARQKTDTIGLLLPVISGDFFAEMLQGIERGVVEGGYDLLIHSTFAGVKPNSVYQARSRRTQYGWIDHLLRQPGRRRAAPPP